MLKLFFLIGAITIGFIHSQYTAKKEIEIVDDFTGEIEYKLGK
jgi:hypothetical protein